MSEPLISYDEILDIWVWSQTSLGLLEEGAEPNHRKLIRERLIQIYKIVDKVVSEGRPKDV